MKKRNLVHMVFSLLLVGAMSFLISCTGPAGPAGLDGKDGINGSDGTDGVDGNVVCLQCHNLVNKAAKETQYEKSIHFEGAYVTYAGSRQACAKCHSHEGFIETQWTGMDTLREKDNVAYPHPSHFDCSTCHDFHSTFDFEKEGADYALRATAPVDLIAYRQATPSTVVTVDLGGPSNLCANCHQPRTLPPTADGSGNFKISSTHWGPHHGPQATMLKGITGAELTDGGKTYPAVGSSSHFKDAGCVTCHMGEYANDEGGHTFTPNVDNCKKCHATATNFDINGLQTKVDGLLATLKTALTAKGVLNASGVVVPATYPIKLASAYYNYALCSFEDKSHGVHNPVYIVALLENSIAAAQ